MDLGDPHGGTQAFSHALAVDTPRTIEAAVIPPQPPEPHGSIPLDWVLLLLCHTLERLVWDIGEKPAC